MVTPTSLELFISKHTVTENLNIVYFNQAKV